MSQQENALDAKRRPDDLGVSAASEACRFLLSEKSQSGGVNE
jgi:hypothetical protein